MYPLPSESSDAWSEAVHARLNVLKMAARKSCAAEQAAQHSVYQAKAEE